MAISSQVAAAGTFQPLGPPPPGEAQPPWLSKPLHDAREQVIADFESRYLSHLLREIARRAVISERSLFEMIRCHRLRKEDFRPCRQRAD